MTLRWADSEKLRFPSGFSRNLRSLSALWEQEYSYNVWWWLFYYLESPQLFMEEDLYYLVIPKPGWGDGCSQSVICSLSFFSSIDPSGVKCTLWVWNLMLFYYIVLCWPIPKFLPLKQPVLIVRTVYGYKWRRWFKATVNLNYLK